MRIGSKTRSLLAALVGGLLSLAAPTSFAANTPRSGHTATLMTNGNILIAGGMNTANTILNTMEIETSASGPGLVNAANMLVARASHTATAMANGKVLIAGGYTTGCVVGAGACAGSPIAEVYDPATGAAPVAVGAGLTPRYNHTATLLNSGTVLLCGGQDNSGNALASCDYFTPNGAPIPADAGGGTCASSPGCVHATGAMAFARAIHSATLLKDGKVWVAAGWNQTAVATNGWLTTTEKFDPATGQFVSAANLFQARGYHTATLMGYGKVLVAGGFNGNEAQGNHGYLDTLEIYDPVADKVLPGPQMSARRSFHSATLSADGSVMIFGGLGNITTTYLPAQTITIANGVTLTDTFSGRTSYGNSTTPSIYALSFASPGQNLSEGVVGTIVDGTIALSTPSIVFPSGVAYFTPGVSTDPASGLQFDLKGTPVTCLDYGKAPAGNCGLIDPTVAMPIKNLNQGIIFFTPKPKLSITDPAPTGNSVDYTGSPTDGGQSALKTTSEYTGTVTLAMPVELLGGTISSGTIVVKSGGYQQTSSFTVVFTGGRSVVPIGTPIVSDGNGGAQMTFAIDVKGITGTITADTSYTCPPNTSAIPLAGTQVTVTLSADLYYVASQVDVSGDNLNVDVGTVTIRQMFFGDMEFYAPSLDQVTLTAPGGGIVGTGRARFGHTATLLPDNNLWLFGGYDCQHQGVGTCGPFVSIASAPAANSVRSDDIYIWRYANSATAGSLQFPRALHTATLLPDGTIVVVGGTNGLNILGTAEVYDPNSQKSVLAKNTMRDVRDLHTATLLPNGRVLIAGGFTTNAVSSTSTNGAEIYYPDTRVFVPTGSMGTARRNHTATSLPDGTVLVVGGQSTTTITNTAEIYHSTTGFWTPAANMPAALQQHTATLLRDGRVMVCGGTNAGGPQKNCYAYNYTNDSWAALANLPVTLYAHTATLLFDGRVLVAGGNNGFGEFQASYIYDPNGNTWSATSGAGTPLLQPRFNANASLLPNNDVLLSGGVNRFGQVLDQYELFHVNASSWAAGGTAFKSGPRAFHTMTLAADGNLYAIGGADGTIGGSGTNIYQAVNSQYFTATPDQFAPNNNPSLRQSTITATTASPFLPGASYNVTGQQFRGGTEASGGGAAAANSSFSYPHLILQAVDGSGGSGSQANSGFVVDLTTQVYLNASNLATEDTSLTVPLPATNNLLPVGWYTTRVGANDIYSNALFVQSGPLRPAAAPAASSGTALGVSSMNWTWSAVAGVDGYNIYESTGGVFLASSPATANPYWVQTGMLANSTSCVSIAGYTITGDGPLSTAGTNYTYALPPIGLTIASVTFDSLLIDWNSNGNTAGTAYEISESTDNFVTSFSTPVPSVLNLQGNEAQITGLSQNTTYYFRIRGINTGGVPSLAFSTVVSTLTRNSVTGVTCGPSLTGPSPTSIQWSWLDSGSVIQYNVYNATTGAQIATIPSGVDVFNDTGLGVNTQRAIQVAALTSAGLGTLSAPATCYTQAAIPLPGVPPMISTGTNVVTINWTPNANPNGSLYQVTFNTFIGTTPVTYPSTTTLFTASLSNLSPSSAVQAQVVALNQVGVASLPLVFGTTYTLPAQPAPLTILGTTPSSLTAAWSVNGNSTSTYYQVTYSTDGSFLTAVSTPILFSALYNGTTITINGLVTGATYYVRVQAQNLGGQLSSFAGPVSTITFNGGAPSGSIAGVLTAIGNSEISGTLGNGRFIDLRSPGGAFPADTVVTISSYNVGGPLCPNGLNVALSIVESPVYQPDRPVFLTASYLPAEVGAIPVTQLALERYEPTSGLCVPLSTTFDTGALLFHATLNHFSLYQLVQVPLATTADTARIFPNPFHGTTDAYVTIDQVPPSTRIRVMTLRGETILDQTANAAGILNWTPTNGAGRSIASGIYLVVVESGSSKKIMKLAVIR